MALSLANAMWHMLHASSHALAAATVALLAVQLDCAQITYDQARGKLQTGAGLCDKGQRSKAWVFLLFAIIFCQMHAC